VFPEVAGFLDIQLTEEDEAARLAELPQTPEEKLVLAQGRLAHVSLFGEMNFELIHRIVDRIDRFVRAESIGFDLSSALLRSLPVAQVERFPEPLALCGPINPNRTSAFDGVAAIVRTLFCVTAPEISMPAIPAQSIDCELVQRHSPEL
jgi:hypothetical protein